MFFLLVIRKMNIKATKGWRNTLTTVKLEKKNCDDSQHHGYRVKRTLIHCYRITKGSSSLVDDVTTSQRRNWRWPGTPSISINSICRYTLQGKASLFLYRAHTRVGLAPHTNTFSGIINDHPNLETSHLISSG